MDVTSEQTKPITKNTGCCTAINGSHVLHCEANFDDALLLCWCCGGNFPSEWECLWSQNGSRCMMCEGCDFKSPCRKEDGQPLDGRAEVDG